MAGASDVTGTIWWDFDGTLISRPFMWSAAALRLLDSVKPGHGVTRASLKKAMASGMPWHPPNREHPQLASAEQWWGYVFAHYARTFTALGCNEAAAEPALSSLRDDILDPEGYRLFDDVVPVLTRLAARGWRQIVVSNHVPELEAIVEGLGLGPLLGPVITSGLVGYEKPHARMFEAALSCSVAGRPIWMIGDNVEADCRPLAAFGASAILVRSAEAGIFECQAADLWAVERMIAGDQAS
ncbi:MAG TPA: HAD-IA family hydrolase [Vicinamibacterales bacterium]|nr:HAD-IA family hydrolase [Vicinamibacterales bacterium]